MCILGPVRGLGDAEIEALRVKLRCKVRYHLGGYCPDIEDVVQESLARLIRAEQTSRIEHPENIGAFLNGICNNVIAEYRRRIAREPVVSDELPDRPNPGISHGESLEIRHSVDAALSLLLSRDRRILTAMFLEGKTAQEICAETGIPETHLKVVVSRAKARFRKIYCESVKPAVFRRHTIPGA